MITLHTFSTVIGVKLKNFSVIILLITILSPQVFKAVVLVDVSLNQAEIIQILCVNKNKPELQCNGKCYLNKQLNGTQESSEQHFPPISESLNLVFLQSENKPKRQILSLSTLQVSSLNEAPYHFLFVKDIFHPPKQVV